MEIIVLSMGIVKYPRCAIFLRMKIIATILLSASFYASAGSTYLYTEVSVAGESMDAFVLRIADRANQHTSASGHEVCGAIRTEDSIHRIEMITSRRNDECWLPIDTEVYFHTHPINQGMNFSSGDYVLPGYLSTLAGVKFQDGKVKRPRKIR